MPYRGLLILDCVVTRPVSRNCDEAMTLVPDQVVLERSQPSQLGVYLHLSSKAGIAGETGRVHYTDLRCRAPPALP